jgi:hypothetical protein
MSSILKLFNGFSFKEKSILISLLAVAVLYGGYFHELIAGGALAGDTSLGMKDMLESMVGIVIALVVIHIIFHIVISLDDVEEAEDERDKAVARRASVLGFNVLFVAVLLVLGRVLFLGAWAESDDPTAMALTAPGLYEITNLLLAGLVASEIVYYSAQLYFYRRGLSG